MKRPLTPEIILLLRLQDELFQLRLELEASLPAWQRRTLWNFAPRSWRRATLLRIWMKDKGIPYGWGEGLVKKQ